MDKANANVNATEADFLERFLAMHVPLAGAMQVRVLEAGPARVRLAMPLGPNINHHGTAFGGSVSAAAVLAGWSLLHTRLVAERLGHARTVVADSRVRYLRPIEKDFEAVAAGPEPGAWADFLDVLRRRGRARLELRVELREGIDDATGQPAAVSDGVYAAMLD